MSCVLYVLDELAQVLRELRYADSYTVTYAVKRADEMVNVTADYDGKTIRITVRGRGYETTYETTYEKLSETLCQVEQEIKSA